MRTRLINEIITQQGHLDTQSGYKEAPLYTFKRRNRTGDHERGAEVGCSRSGNSAALGEGTTPKGLT